MKEPFVPIPVGLRLWGLVGAAVAAVFALWMFFFPQFVPTHFAWVAEPRLTQVFIGAGYIFRTVFFLQFVLARNWLSIRWTFWGNLAFTGTLLLATLWHADEMNWRFLVAHVWVVFYTFEPVTMIFTAPMDSASRALHLHGGGPLLPWFKRFIVLVVGVLFLFGALLIINPIWLDLRWPWDLNEFDARIIAAWFNGWALWLGTIYFVRDWDEGRLGVFLAILFGAAVSISSLIFLQLFSDRGATRGYIGLAIAFTVGLAFFAWRQERARPARTA
jgi:hypothetical protein